MKFFSLSSQNDLFLNKYLNFVFISSYYIDFLTFFITMLTFLFIFIKTVSSFKVLTFNITTSGRLSLSILKLAYKYTSNPQKYALYLSRSAFEDFYVDEDLQVTYHEAENILLVDRWEIKEDHKRGWNTSLTSRAEECITREDDPLRRCTNDVSLNINKICRNEYSDHNYYAICRNIFSPKLQDGSVVGLLHNTPSSLDNLHGITSLLHKCLYPPDQEPRSLTIVSLIDILTEITNDFDLNDS